VAATNLTDVKPAACIQPPMLSTLGNTGKRERVLWVLYSYRCTIGVKFARRRGLSNSLQTFRFFVNFLFNLTTVFSWTVTISRIRIQYQGYILLQFTVSVCVYSVDIVIQIAPEKQISPAAAAAVIYQFQCPRLVSRRSVLMSRLQVCNHPGVVRYHHSRLT